MTALGTAQLAYYLPACVGEGAWWDDASQRLWWVDILNHQVYVFDPATRCNTGWDVGEDVGTVVLDEKGRAIIALRDGIARLDPATGLVERGATANPDPDIRFNDGKCDPAGRFWAGTMAYDCRQGGGALYRFNRFNEVETVLDKVTISNGLVWNAAGNRFYYIDSLDWTLAA